MSTSTETSPELRWSAVEEKRKKEDNSFFTPTPGQVMVTLRSSWVWGFISLIVCLLLNFTPPLTSQELDKEELGRKNIRLLFSREIDPGSFSYAPQKGESLYEISRKFNMCPELLIEINEIKDREKLPDRLKIVPGKFTIMVERGKNILTLYREGQFFKEYKVATGRDLSTPLGEYWIASKLISPPWIFEGKVITSDQPDYPLGTRWLGLSGTRLGLHGTKAPEYIGQYVSSGCIRMFNTDIEELFNIVPFGTKVIIKE